MRSPVFLDTVGLIAVWDKSDPWHNLAVPVYEELLQERRTLITSLYVLLECGNAAARTPFRNEVAEIFHRHRLDRLGLVLVPSPAEHAAAWNAYEKRHNAAAGLVDQYSVTIMKTARITHAFTNDQHFKAAGVITLF